MTSLDSTPGEGFPARVLREARIVADMLKGTDDPVCKADRRATEALSTARLSTRDTRVLRRFAREVRLLLVSLGA